MAGQLKTIQPGDVTAKPLTRVSPSLGERLLACELSVAFRLDPRYDFLRRPEPSATLGTISHDLAERAARGEFDALSPSQIEETLSTAWETAVAQAELKVSAAHPAAPTPPATRWPGYAQTHDRVINLLSAEVARRRLGSVSAGSLSLEETLEPEGIPLHGRADRIERTPEGVDLIDLKTGWTLPDELKPSHRRQLLAYAFLWYAVHGDWPGTASIQRLDGERFTFEVDPSEAEAVATELVRALADFNHRAANSASALELASPSPGACQYCSYRAVCPPYFQAVDTGWPSYKKSLVGLAQTVTRGRVTNRVTLTLEHGNIESSHVNLVNVPDDLTPAVGQRIAVIDATPTRVAQDLRLSWDSVMCVWATTPPR